MVQLSATRCSCIAILWVSVVSFAAITLYVASQLVFIVVVDFVIDSVRKILDTTSYIDNHKPMIAAHVYVSKSQISKQWRMRHICRRFKQREPTITKAHITKWSHYTCVRNIWLMGGGSSCCPRTGAHWMCHRLMSSVLQKTMSVDCNIKFFVFCNLSAGIKHIWSANLNNDVPTRYISKDVAKFRPPLTRIWCGLQIYETDCMNGTRLPACLIAAAFANGRSPFQHAPYIKASRLTAIHPVICATLRPSQWLWR
jgi:hypothetical protein